MQFRNDPATQDAPRDESRRAGFALPPDKADVKAVVCRNGTKEEIIDHHGVGAARLDVKLEVERGQRGEGYWLWWSIPSWSEHADRMLKQLCDGLGVTVEPGMDVRPQDLWGKTAVVRIKHETYEGKLRAKIRWFHAPEGKRASRPQTAQPTSGDAADESLPF